MTSNRTTPGITLVFANDDEDRRYSDGHRAFHGVGMEPSHDRQILLHPESLMCLVGSDGPDEDVAQAILDITPKHHHKDVRNAMLVGQLTILAGPALVDSTVTGPRIEQWARDSRLSYFEMQTETVPAQV